jgi:hypothetical protein
MSKPVSLTGQYKDYGNDTDGDGYCDCLTLEVEIVVNREGEYSISGCLMACRDPSGQSGYTIGWSERVVLAKLGQHKVKLDFVGADI